MDIHYLKYLCARTTKVSSSLFKLKLKPKFHGKTDWHPLEFHRTNCLVFTYPFRSYFPHCNQAGSIAYKNAIRFQPLDSLQRVNFSTNPIGHHQPNNNVDFKLMLFGAMAILVILVYFSGNGEHIQRYLTNSIDKVNKIILDSSSPDDPHSFGLKLEPEVIYILGGFVLVLALIAAMMNFRIHFLTASIFELARINATGDGDIPLSRMLSLMMQLTIMSGLHSLIQYSILNMIDDVEEKIAERKLDGGQLQRRQIQYGNASNSDVFDQLVIDTVNDINKKTSMWCSQMGNWLSQLNESILHMFKFR